MTDIRIRKQEGCDEQLNLAWDSVFICGELSAQGGYADWVLAGESETGNIGGLQATQALHTAIIICLFTDKRAPDYLLEELDDPRGWWGDFVDIRADLYEREMGSLIWTQIERGILNEETALIVTDMAREALQVLIEQGAVARFDIKAEAHILENRLEMVVQAYSQAGALVYDQRFANIWQQVEALAA